jgi:hypothetical protein
VVRLGFLAGVRARVDNALDGERVLSDELVEGDQHSTPSWFIHRHAKRLRTG